MSIDFIREGVALHIARHIEVLCVTSNPGPWRIVGGTATDLALGIVKKWNERSIAIFATLLRADAVVTKSTIAKRSKCSRNAVDGFWSDTLANAAVVVHVAGSTEPQKMSIFPRGVRISSPDGVRLVLRKEQLPYSVLQRIYEGNRPIVLAANENHNAVKAAIEAHPDREAAEAARESNGQRAQLALVANKKTGTDGAE